MRKVLGGLVRELTVAGEDLRGVLDVGLRRGHLPVEGDVVELEPIFAVRGERLVRIGGYPPHAERFERVGIDIACVLGESPGAQRPPRR